MIPNNHAMPCRAGPGSSLEDPRNSDRSHVILLYRRDFTRSGPGRLLRSLNTWVQIHSLTAQLHRSTELAFCNLPQSNPSTWQFPRAKLESQHWAASLRHDLGEMADPDVRHGARLPSPAGCHQPHRRLDPGSGAGHLLAGRHLRAGERIPYHGLQG